MLNECTREAWHLFLSSLLPPDEDSASCEKNVCGFTHFCCKLPPMVGLGPLGSETVPQLSAFRNSTKSGWDLGCESYPGFGKSCRINAKGGLGPTQQGHGLWSRMVSSRSCCTSLSMPCCQGAARRLESALQQSREPETCMQPLARSAATQGPQTTSRGALYPQSKTAHGNPAGGYCARHQECPGLGMTEESHVTSFSSRMRKPRQ